MDSPNRRNRVTTDGNGSSIELAFELASHSIDAVQRAAYRFSDRLSISTKTDDTLIHCTLFAVGGLAGSLINEFRIEVLDQVLRERIRTETEATRNLILALAFSKTGLVEQ